MFKELYKNRLILTLLFRTKFNMLMYRMINRNNRKIWAEIEDFKLFLEA